MLLCVILLCINVHTAKAQLSSRIYRTKVLADTLIANSNRDFLYNNINITNLTNDEISILVNITMPDGWITTTQKVLTVSLAANQNTIINLRLLPQNSVSADWQTVKIDYRLNKGVELITDTFRVKVEEFKKFKANLPMPEVVLGMYQKDISFPVYLQNRGNTRQAYTIKYYNNLLDLDYTQEINLDPNKDTTYNIPLRMSSTQWDLLRSEEVKVYAGIKGGDKMSLIQTISKIGSRLKQNPSAYQDMPLQLETGFTMQGRDDFQYYGAVHGRMDLGNERRLSFDVRSKTIAQGQFLDNDIYLVNYESNKWDISAGNIQQLSHFLVDGFGTAVKHKWKNEENQDKHSLGVYTMLKSRLGNSMTFGGDAVITVKPDVLKLKENVVANIDSTNLLNSYIASQTAEFELAHDMTLSILTGVGLEQSRQKVINGNTSQVGSSFGYNFMWRQKRFEIQSDLLRNSNAFPGVFKGQRMQNHEGKLLFGRYYVGGYYDYNLRKQNIYTDTQLFSEVFNLRVANYGARTGVNFKNASFNFSAGIQEQQQSDSIAAPIYNYRYLNLNSSFGIGKRTYFLLNSYYGTGLLAGQESTTSVNIMSHQGTLQLYFAGLSARYDNGPYFYHEFLQYLSDGDKYSRLLLSPYLEISAFDQNLTVRTQFNYIKTQPDTLTTRSFLGNLVYHNYKNGFDLSMTGILPIDQPTAEPYATVALRVQLHVPFVPIRKYYTVKLVLFKDENTNNKLDAGEGPITGQMLALNDNLFVSNGDGEVEFKNVAKQDFKADFGYTSKIKGWIPQGGAIQTFALRGNKTVYIPYKKSKVLNGRLILESDDKSNIDFNLSNIKITATSNDTVRATYSTITDSKGEFYFNLPAGIYTIELSTLAFDDNFKPTEYAQQADLVVNNEKSVHFYIRQKRRVINIRKKD